MIPSWMSLRKSGSSKSPEPPELPDSPESDGSPPSITEIAAEAGFSDANYFARSFKKATGMTPSQYRKTCGADLDKRGLPD